MADTTPKKADIYLAQVEGQPARLIRTTDPRLARRHVLAGIHPPAVEVRKPTTEEAMDMALDGVAVEDIEPTPAPSPTPTGENTGDQSGGGEPQEQEDLNDPLRMNPDDDPADHGQGTGTLPLGGE